jgi:hypothetical protein
MDLHDLRVPPEPVVLHAVCKWKSDAFRSKVKYAVENKVQKNIL